MSTWIDFKALRAKLKFEDVLMHYGVELKTKGSQHMGFCPLPKHSGNRNSPSFSANLERGIFHCFGCQAKGNVLDFAVLMNGGSPTLGRDVRKAALVMQEKFDAGNCKSIGRKKTKGEKEEPTPNQLELESVVNPPLDFELKGLDRSHPYLTGRGFTQETIAHFGLGYCERGSLAGRIAIPLHDADGNLIGYAGRVVDDTTINAENPRYRLPATRERDGKALEFRKTRFLYNGFRVRAPSENLIVVEGFPSVWWLAQNGYPRAVATMGAECAEEQAALIISRVAPSGTVWIMPDGDEAGLKFAQSLLRQISPHRLIRWALLPDGRQPTDCSKQQLDDHLA